MERRKPPVVPKDGPGPRGFPDCYYTSRVLDSTFRYVKFVKKLRAQEEEYRKAEEHHQKEIRDQQTNDFFNRCDRRSLINKVANRVGLCMESYEQDLQQKRNRLAAMFAKEEEYNINQFVIQAQAGAEQIWQDKQERLRYLLAKRQKEHEDKYKDTPLSKCTHITPCIYKLRAKEAQEIQLYQMREKQARKLTEREYDNMWHEVALKEADALAARMEVDAINRLRADLDCKKYSDYQLEMNRRKRERERQQLKAEQMEMQRRAEEDAAKELEERRLAMEKQAEVNRRTKESNELAAAEAAVRQAELDAIQETWNSLAEQGQAEEMAKVEFRKRLQKDTDECNRQLLIIKASGLDNPEEKKIIEAESKRQQDVVDRRRCDYILTTQKANREARAAMIEQIKDRARAREEEHKRMCEENEYQRQLCRQTKMLCDERERREHQRALKYQSDLADQIAYNNLRKEREYQEEMEQRMKGQKAAAEYQEELNKMLNRPFLSDEVHPFMKSMYQGLSMKPTCPCVTPDYCKRDDKHPCDTK